MRLSRITSSTVRSRLVSGLPAISIGINLYLYRTQAVRGRWLPSNDLHAVKLSEFAEKQPVKEEVLENESGSAGLCATHSQWHEAVPNMAVMETSLERWNFRSRIRCPPFSIQHKKQERLKVTLDCESSEPTIKTSQTDSSDDIFRIAFGDPCLVSVIENCCKGDKHVPNVVHFIWYSDRELEYFQFLSFMSVLRFMKPCLILLHGDYIPRGEYWDYFVSISPNIINVRRTRPEKIFGRELAFKEHASDIMRIEGLQMYGGLYLDFDEVLLRSPEPLRQYEYTMGHELSYTMGSQFVMAKRNATFLQEWYRSYRDDYKKSWAYNALWVPAKIAKNQPHLIHVEGYNFTRPNWKNVKQIFKENYDWSTNYAMHMYVRWYKNKTDVDIIRTLNTTIGSVSRHVLLGNKELCIE